jgi:hypothetical protein
MKKKKKKKIGLIQRSWRRKVECTVGVQKASDSHSVHSRLIQSGSHTISKKKQEGISNLYLNGG